MLNNFCQLMNPTPTDRSFAVIFLVRVVHPVFVIHVPGLFFQLLAGGQSFAGCLSHCCKQLPVHLVRIGGREGGRREFQ